MAPAPRRWRRITPVTAAAALLIGLGTAAPVTAHAATPAPTPPDGASSPSPLPTTVPGLRKTLDELNEEAAILTERYNKARLDLGNAKKAQRVATVRAARLRAQVAPARERLGRLAAANYMTGAPDVIFGVDGSPDGLAERAFLTQSQAAAVEALHRQIKEADAAQRTAEAKTAEVAKATEDARQAREAARKKVAEVMRRLDRLTTTRVSDPRSGLRAEVKGSDLPANMARKALTQLGAPYVWAASGPNSCVCSGLVVWSYAQVGKPGLPHYTGALYGLGTKVPRDQLRSGDLVYFGSNLHHMGIYLSDGKYVHAPRTGDVVKISRLSDRSDYAGANRIT